MTLKQRNQFMKIYKGTEEVIRDVCREGAYQSEFLKHAACLQTVKPQHKKCEEKYQETMNFIRTPKANNSAESATNPRDDVKNVCWWEYFFDYKNPFLSAWLHIIRTHSQYIIFSSTQKKFMLVESNKNKNIKISFWQLIPGIFGLFWACNTKNLWCWDWNIHSWIPQKDVIDLRRWLLQWILPERRKSMSEFILVIDVCLLNLKYCKINCHYISDELYKFETILKFILNWFQIKIQNALYWIYISNTHIYTIVI